MKSIHYKIATEENRGTKEEPKIEKIIKPQIATPASSENIELVKRIAYNGEYTIEDDGQPEPELEPTQLDRIEAQTTYTAMMTDTLLEV